MSGSLAVLAHAAPDTYTGPSGGSYNAAGNWSAGTPTSSSDVIINGNGSTNVSVALAAGEIGNAGTLQVDAGDVLTLGNNSTLNVNGNVTVNGLIQFMPVANVTYLRLNAVGTLLGTGAIDFNYGGGAGDGHIAGNGSLVTNNTTIRGAGTIEGGAALNNGASGIIDANQSGGPQIYWDFWNSGTALTNLGTIRATNGGLLTLAGDNGGSLDSTGGNIVANGANSIVRLINGASVTGGNYSTSGGGEIVVEAGNTGFASPQSLAGVLRARNNARLYLSGTINDTGTINISPGANASYLNLNGNLTLNGNGALVLGAATGTGDARVEGSGQTLTNGTNHTIRGAGSLGTGGAIIVNNGIVDANVNGLGIYIDAQNNGGVATFTNNNIVRATNGGTITLAGDNGGTFLQGASGVVRADGTGSIVNFVNSAALANGSLATSSGGLIQVAAGNVGYLTNVANSGTVEVQNNSRLYLNGTINDTGTITLKPVVNAAYMNMNGDVTFTGGGALVLGAAAGTGDARVEGSGQILTNSASHTIRGWGSLGTGGVQVVNNGTINANVAGGGIYVDAWNNGGNVGYTNNATASATNGATLTYAGDNGGTFLQGSSGVTSAVGSGSIFQFVNSATLSGGTITSSGGGLLRVPDGHSGYVNNLTQSGTFEVQNNARLYIAGTINDTGTITVKPTGATSYLSLSGDATLSGSGAVVLSAIVDAGSNYRDARLDGTGGTTLTNSASHTIRGVGSLGVGSILIVNNGIIDANATPYTDAALYIDAQNNGGNFTFTNNNIARATNGSILIYAGENGGAFQQGAAGVTRADGAGSVVELRNGAFLKGGSLTTTGGGLVRVGRASYPTTAVVQNLTLTTGSSFTVPSASRLYAFDTLSINGTLTLDATGAGQTTFFDPENDVTLTGTGSLVIASNTNGGAQISGNSSVTIASGFLVHGGGSLGVGSTILTNNGTIRNDVAPAAGVGSGLYIDAQNSGAGVSFTNNNIVETTNGGTLYYAGENGGRFAQSPTAITRATGSGSVVEMRNDAFLAGGNLTTSGGGLIRIGASDYGSTAHWQDLTLTSGSAASVSVSNRLYVHGTITNNGTLTVGNLGGAAYIDPEGPVTFAGTGTIALSSDQNGAAQFSGNDSVTFDAGQTVRGNGSIGVGSTAITNNGTIQADVPGSATVYGGIYIDAQNAGTTVTFTNNGTVRATNGATLTFAGENGGAFGGTGPIVADVNSTIQTLNSAGGELGPVTGNGRVLANNSASVGFRSLRVANVAADNSGTLRITAGGGTTGTSKVGTVTITNNGRIDITDHALIVDGTPAATIRGYIASARNGGPWNGSGITSSLVTSTNKRSVGYAVASEIFSTVPATFQGQPITASSVIVRYTVLGDTDLNGAVNFDDLLHLAKNYGTSGKDWAQGDLDYNGDVNFDDLLALAKSYNNSLPAAAEHAMLTQSFGSDFASDFAMAQSMVPEPTAALAVLGLGASLFPSRRRRN